MIEVLDRRIAGGFWHWCAVALPLCAVMGAPLADAAPSSDSDGALQEIIVTAQQRDERAQDVPISFLSLSQGDLSALSATRVQDIEQAVPSVSFGDGNEQGRLGIRGILDYPRDAGYDGRVGVYVDGVYIGRPYLTTQALTGIGQIDVLSGPQGTLFGRDSDAGVIVLTTVRPGDTFNGEAEARVGNFGAWQLAARVNVPLSSKVSAQFSATSQNSDGYYHNATLDRDAQGQQDLSARAQIRLRPTEALDITISADGGHDDNSSLHYAAPPAPGADPYTIHSYVNDRARRSFGGGSINATYDLPGDYRLTSITAYRSGSEHLLFNNETGPVPIMTADAEERSRQVSQELRLASPRTDRYDYVAGLYYLHQENHDDSSLDLGNGLRAFPFPVSRYAGAVIPFGGDVDTDSYAAFFNGNYRLTSVVELTAGVRYTAEQKSLRNYHETDPLGVIAGRVAGYGDDMASGHWLPRGGVNLHLDDNTMLYGSISRGFKSGGWNVEANPVALLKSGIQVGAESATNYEIGLKSDFWRNRARLNVAAFREEFDNFQVFTMVDTRIAGYTIGTTHLTNAASAVSQGFEVAVSVMPVDGLRLSLNYSYTDSTYDQFKGGAGTGVNGAPLDANGVQTPYAPRNKFYIAADDTRDLGGGVDLLTHVGYSHQSAENFDPKVANPLYGRDYAIPGYGLVDARVGLSRDGWGVFLWGRNLGDNHYRVFANRTALLSNPAVLYGEPRSYGGTIKYSF